MGKRGARANTAERRGLSRKIHSVEKGRLDDSQMSQKLEKDPSKCQATRKKLQKAKLNMSERIEMGKYKTILTNTKGWTFRDFELICR